MVREWPNEGQDEAKTAVGVSSMLSGVKNMRKKVGNLRPQLYRLEEEYCGREASVRALEKLCVAAAVRLGGMLRASGGRP